MSGRILKHETISDDKKGYISAYFDIPNTPVEEMNQMKQNVQKFIDKIEEEISKVEGKINEGVANEQDTKHLQILQHMINPRPSMPGEGARQEEIVDYLNKGDNFINQLLKEEATRAKEEATRAKEEELLHSIFDAYKIKFDKCLLDCILKERPFLVIYKDECSLHTAKNMKEVRRLCNGRSYTNTYIMSADLYSANNHYCST